MKLVGLLVFAIATIATAAPCPTSPRLVFETVGGSVPQLTWDGARYQLVGGGGKPLHLTLTTFGFAKDPPASLAIGPGASAATATNGKQLAIAYVGTGATVPLEGLDKDGFIMIDGRRTYAPRKDRPQSYFLIVDGAGKPLAPPLALGDQRVMHISPGVAVAWNPRDKEWGVIWSEFNVLKLGRVSSAGKLLGITPLVVDGFIDHASRMVWSGSAYAILARANGLVLYEIDAKGVHATKLPIAADPIEPVIAWSGSAYAIAYRTSKPGVAPAPPVRHNGRNAPMPPPSRPSPPDSHELWFATVANGQVGAPVQIATASNGPFLETPVIAADGAQLVIAFGRNQAGRGFDDRLEVVRVDAAGKLAAGYPKRLDPEDVHQGYASIAGTGCDLAISYILGDPNGAVRIGVARAP